MKPNFFLAAFIVLALSLPFALSVSAVTVGESPSARGYHQMTYDAESERIVLYGGQTGYVFDPIYQNHETWLFDPKTNEWTNMSPLVSPGGFSGGDMTYDSKADRSILSIISDDFSTLQTWAYDTNTNTWTRLADGPRNMVGQRIAYDSESDRIIMFGGFEFTKFQLVDETWAYDYNTNTWTNMAPRIHPKPRNFHGMVYDAKADRMVAWGGDIKGADKPTIWTYDYNTNTWQALEPEYSPVIRDYMIFVYDDKADKIIMYGGFTYGNDETWMYDLNINAWKQLQPTNNPGILSRYGMVYVRDINRTILFGGQDGSFQFQYKRDTWSYNLKANRWTKINAGD